MTLDDLLGLRHGFYKLVYVRSTRRCPLQCRHCCASSGPSAGIGARPEQLRRWAESIGKLEAAVCMGIEGGEPFVALDALRAALDAASRAGLSTAVLTSAFWADDPHAATRILRSLPRISSLIISADEFHEEFVPLSTVAHAIEVGLEHADHVGIQICLGGDKDAFMERLHDEIGEDLLSETDILMTILQYTGRATTTGVAERPAEVEGLPEGRCPFLGTPVIREDGVFVACCHQEVVLGDGPALLHLGNVDEMDVAEFMAQVDSDVYLQTLRVYGPKAIALEAMEKGWGWRPRAYREGDICDLCRDLTARPELVARFQREHGDPDYRRELALARLMAYSETAPLDAIKQGVPT